MSDEKREHREENHGCVACGSVWPCDTATAEARCAEMERALEFYADIKNYNGVAGHPDQTPPIVFERGARARALVRFGES